MSTVGVKGLMMLPSGWPQNKGYCTVGPLPVGRT